MTAREHIGNYESRLREYTNFALRGIKRTLKECGPRESASEAEYKAQQIMAKEMEGCCESVRFESFRTAPHAFLAWVNLCVGLGLASALCYHLGLALVGVILMLFAFTAMILEFLLYKQALDPFFPKKESHNMIAVRKPGGEIKRRLILCGHSDSAYEFHYTYWGDKYFHTVKLLTAVIAVGVFSIV
ncbi:MAG: hypothetical protein LBQ33_02530, partial [Oscillospiraceae bacterium]|nr:hypothetical protein [Oscillospiraceae bacterium]